MKAIDLIHEYADRILMCPMTPNRQPMPGEFISRLPEEEREALRNLKSEDLQTAKSIIPSWIMLHNENYGRRKNGRLYDYQGRLVVKLENDGILR